MKGFGNISCSVNPQKIHYAEAEFSEIKVREVYDGDYPNGTYHIKPIKKVNLDFLLNFLREQIPYVKIDLTDPEGVLKVEYPIYLISGGSRKVLIQEIEDADIKLSEFIKNKQKGGF